MVTSIGHLRYNMGCRDEKQCSSLVNRRSALRRNTNDILVCSECCTGNVCNSAGCGKSGYIEPRGPVCYNCGLDQTDVNDCNKITVCGQDEVCMLHKTTNAANHAVRYKTGCEEAKVCQTELSHVRDAMSMISPDIVDANQNFIQIGSTCLISCCQGDLCNDGCSNTTAGPTATTAHVTASTSGTTAHVTTSTSGTTTSSGTTAAPLDPCLTNPCMRGTCMNVGDSYACACDTGFWGQHCENAIDYCQPNPCIHGTCSNRLGTAVCECEEGFTGDTCNEVVDPCTPNPCQNGSCIRDGNSYNCSCDDNYYGINCDKFASHCFYNPCQNNGTCSENINAYNGYTCTCQGDWMGPNCTNRVCPSGWKLYDNSCLLFDQNIGRSFSDAKDYCHSLGATLVNVQDQQKNNFIKTILTQSSTYQYWIGITDADREGQYQIIDSGDYVHFYDWSPGEPNDNERVEDEDCVVFSSYVPNWQWTDIDCNRHDAYTICEQ